MPSLGEEVQGVLESKRRKTGFQIRIRIGANMHSSFLGGILMMEAGARRSHVILVVVPGLLPGITILVKREYGSEIRTNQESS